MEAIGEVKLPQDESLHRMTKIYVNGSLHCLTWKRSVFAFDVKRESHCWFPLPLPASEGNDNKDIGLVEYKGKLIMTCIDRKSNFMKIWIMEDHNRKQWSKIHAINIEVLTGKEPHVSPLAFCNADVVLMGEYFPDVTFFNIKNGDIDVLRLGKGLLHGCFLFQITFTTEEKKQSDSTTKLSSPQE